jgi:Cdc6-like AAA superfamily ATPase
METNNRKVVADSSEGPGATKGYPFRAPIKLKRWIKSGTIEEYAVSDDPIKSLEEDYLGFRSYIKALNRFITSEKTKTPITISIEGDWGTGKTSLMLLLKKSLDKSSIPTVWFNAWLFNQEEQIWAALVQTIMNQLKNRYNACEKFLFWLRLTFRRFSLGRATWMLLWNVFFPVLLLLAALLVDKDISKKLDQDTITLLLSPFQFLYNKIGLVFPFLKMQPQIIKLILSLGAIIVVFNRYSSIIKNPFQISIQGLINQPNYEDRIGFIYNFKKDFENIISIATNPITGKKSSKIVIFIDDLDRCDPTKSADIIQAINQFLDSEKCVFVIGMNPDAVAASIEAKYKDVFDVMKKRNPNLNSPGRLFLDKIIQLPLRIPRPTSGFIETFWLDCLKNQENKSSISESDVLIGEADYLIEEGKKTIELIQRGKDNEAFYEDWEVSEAKKIGYPFLKQNPRQLKRFENLFRVLSYIANENGILMMYMESELSDEFSNIKQNYEHDLNLKIVALWVVLLIRWPDLLNVISDGLWINDLRRMLTDISDLVDKKEVWIRSQINDDETAAMKKIKNLRIQFKDSSSHWCHFPWESWLDDIDFRTIVKALDPLWRSPESGEIDVLEILISMAPPN